MAFEIGFQCGGGGATKNALILKGINTFFFEAAKKKVALCTLLWLGGAFMRDIFLGPDPGA